MGDGEDAVFGDFVAGAEPLPEEAVELNLRSEALQQALASFQGTVLAVTHDRWFARSFDRFLVFRADGAVVVARRIDEAHDAQKGEAVLEIRESEPPVGRCGGLRRERRVRNDDGQEYIDVAGNPSV